MKYDDLVATVLKLFPEATFTDDMGGQLIIHTDLYPDPSRGNEDNYIPYNDLTRDEQRLIDVEK